MMPAHLIRPWTQAVAFALLLVLGLMLCAVPARVEAQTSGASKFDHFKTGFPLNGAHGTLRCESCHTSGIFKGTPRDCQTCHTTGSRLSRSNVVMPQTHIPTNVATQTCDSCHSTQTFTNPRFSHTTGVPPGTGCQTCHDGARTQGKPATHIPTRAACDTCHNTRNWSSGKPDHSGFNTSTNCASCHNGATASGKSANHIPVAANCISCHNVSGWKPTSWNHTQVIVAAQCATCHSGRFPPADGRPGNHIPYQSLAGVAITNCDSCHKNGYGAWNPGRFHSNVSIVGQCATCHLSSAYGLTSKPANTTHSTVTGACEACHNTSGWAGAKVEHSKFTAATQCASCHNGSTATGKPGSHIPVTANCYGCHNTTGWTPTKWNHTQVTVAGTCSTCHSGAFPPADGRPSNHIPYQSLAGVAITNCDSCHKSGYSAWNPGRFHSNVSVIGQCSTCHLTSVYGLTSKPANSLHATVTGGCESCHNTSGWAGAKVDHSKFTAVTQCASCHNGSTATGKPGSHIPVTVNCYGCHNTTGWTPTKWNHTQVTVAGTCSTCHSGAFPPADGRPSNHIPYQAITGVAITNCDSCHKSGYAAWNPGRFHSNVSVIGQCSTCHLTAVYGLTSKPNTALHAGIASNCESCHKSTASWASVTYTHAASNAVGTGTCDNCHNGSTATGKPGNHIPIQVGGVKCDGCHRSQQAWTTSVTMNHTAVSAQACKSCHTPTYAGSGATAKPNNHIPEVQLLNGATMDCKACHSNTNSGGFGSAVMNHNSSQGGGSGWCYACHNAGTAFLGSMERKSLTHQKKTGVTDCSQSGCHRPLGTFGITYRNWN